MVEPLKARDIELSTEFPSLNLVDLVKLKSAVSLRFVVIACDLSLKSCNKFDFFFKFVFCPWEVVKCVQTSWHKQFPSKKLQRA